MLLTKGAKLYIANEGLII